MARAGRKSSQPHDDDSSSQAQGIGDVQVRPSPGPAGGEPGSVLNIELTSPYGRARFETPARGVTDFLRRAYEIVPAGQESGHIDIDAELNDLLRQAS